MLALVLAVAISATPTADAKYVMPIGVGSQKCAVWVRHHKTRDVVTTAQDEWLSGFLTAFNTFGRPSVRTTSFFGHDLSNVAAAITSACARKPDQPVFEAVTDFIGNVQRSQLPGQREGRRN